MGGGEIEGRSSQGRFYVGDAAGGERERGGPGGQGSGVPR